MTALKSLMTFTAALFFVGSVMAEDAKPVEWLFVHTAASAEMTSDATLVIPVTRDIFAFTDRPNRMHGYLNAHEWVSQWDEGDNFSADPPNAVLTWVDGGDVKEAEVVITGASTLGHGRSIAYEVKLKAGEQPVGDLAFVSVFVDSGQGDFPDFGPGGDPGG